MNIKWNERRTSNVRHRILNGNHKEIEKLIKSFDTSIKTLENIQKSLIMYWRRIFDNKLLDRGAERPHYSMFDVRLIIF
jgi:hypothetical protein